jgi:putative hydrolase of the HAD superfamily
MSDVLGLVVDWGGVLTRDVRGAMRAWAEADDLDVEAFGSFMGKWLGPAAQLEAEVNPVHALERGEIEIADFERQLASALLTNEGHPVSPEGLMDRLFALRTRHVGASSSCQGKGDQDRLAVELVGQHISR